MQNVKKGSLYFICIFFFFGSTKKLVAEDNASA